MMTTVKDVLSFFDRLWKALPNDHVALVFWTAVLVGMAVVIGFSLAHWLTKHRIELAQLQHQRELNQLTAASFSEKTVLAVREERSAMASPSPAPEPANERDSLEVEPLTLGAFVSAREAFERSSADATQLQMEAFDAAMRVSALRGGASSTTFRHLGTVRLWSSIPSPAVPIFKFVS